MEIPDESKPQIMLTILGRRYESMEKIRERLYTISIWTLGVFLTLAGYLIQRRLEITWPSKVFLIAVVLLATLAVTFYIRDLEGGFKNQLRIVVRLENGLRLYEPGYYGTGDEGILPAQMAQAGESGGRGHLFSRTTLLVYMGAAGFIAAIIVSGWLL
jgi:hypothetical protein